MECVSKQDEPQYGIVVFRFRPVDENKDESKPLSLQVVVSDANAGIEPFKEGQEYYLSIDPVNSRGLNKDSAVMGTPFDEDLDNRPG